MNTKSKSICLGAMIAALYVVITCALGAFNLANGIIQIRLSEALCILPVFSVSAIPGVTIGCFISNLILGANIFDVIFGSLATLLGLLGTYFLRRFKLLSLLPSILSNSIILPLVFRYAYGFQDAFIVLVISIFVSEFISVGIFGFLLRQILEKKLKLFKVEN